MRSSDAGVMLAARGARLAATLVALCGCSSSSDPRHDAGTDTQAITNGTSDDADLGVVAVGDFCTGTLIAPRVVLTAAHCVVGGGSIPIVFGPTIDEGTPVDSLLTWAHPDYRGSPPDHDIALVLLSDRAPPRVAPSPLFDGPLDASFVGRPIRIVGFGASSAGSGSEQKREGMTQIDSIAETTFDFGPSPSRTCSGDSGGPAFIDDEAGMERLVGVTSVGDSDCAGSATDVRVDVHADDFIRPFLLATAEGAAALGDRCFYDAQCQSGACFASDDAGTLRYCTHACLADEACPKGMQCGPAHGEPRDAAMCALEGPVPGALGTECLHDFDCASWFCALDQTGEARFCSVRCLPDVEPACPDELRCEPDPEDPARYACALPTSEAPADPSGGCALTAHLPSPTLPVEALPFVLWPRLIRFVRRQRANRLRFLELLRLRLRGLLRA
jgi:hypothetical protein